MKKRILYITESFGGGVFSYLVDLSNRLSDEYEICIAYSIRAQTPDNFQEYFDSKIKLIRIQNFTRSINMIKDIKAAIEIKKIANEFKPDIIHLHSSKAGVIGRVIFNFSNVRLYYTPHGYSFLMQNAPKIKRDIYWSIEKIAGYSKSTTISCSKGEFDESKKLTKRNKLVNNGIDVDELSKLEKNTNLDGKEKNISIFTIGRISEQKNPELFNEIAQQFPNIKFIWIGDGNLKYKLTAKNITVTGWVQREDAIKLAIKSDFFILTSLWEGLPISLLEAMFLKKQCFVTNVIGNKDVIEDGKNGFVCNDLNEFKKKIKIVLVSKQLKEKVSKNAKLDVLSNYNTKVMVEQYNRIYSGK